MSAQPVGPEELAARLAEDITAVFGRDLRTLAAHGSWVFGDFCPGRSDLDVLSVLARDPEADDLTELAKRHADLEHDHPEWAGHVEVAYLAADAVRDLLDQSDRDHVMLRISPGEPLHELPLTRHGLLDWDAARRADRAVCGASPATVLPPIPSEAVEAVLREHLRSWPGWLRESAHTGFHAYAVLTVARCRVRLDTQRPVSKRTAAQALAEVAPGWADLLRWAERWWYQGGRADESAPPEVAGFVAAMAADR